MVLDLRSFALGATSIIAAIVLSIVANLLTPFCRSLIDRLRNSFAKRSAKRAKKRLDELKAELDTVSRYAESEHDFSKLVIGGILDITHFFVVGSALVLLGAVCLLAALWPTPRGLLGLLGPPTFAAYSMLALAVWGRAIFRAQNVRSTVLRVRRYDQYRAHMEESIAALEEVVNKYGKLAVSAIEPSEQLIIHSATYGKGDKTVNVSDVLRPRVSAGRLQITVSNELVAELGGDPVKGIQKELRVVYSHAGKKHTVVVPENRPLTLPQGHMGFNSRESSSQLQATKKERRRTVSTTGEKPGKGIYICVQCGQRVVLDDDTDTLPPCPRCNGTEYRP